MYVFEVHVYLDVSDEGCVFASYHILPYFWEQNLSLNLKLSIKLEMAEQWAAPLSTRLYLTQLVTGTCCYIWFICGC